MSKPKSRPLTGAEDTETQGQNNAPNVTTESASVEQHDTPSISDNLDPSDNAPAVEASTPEIQDIITCPPNLHKMGKELVTVTQELTDAERIDLAGVMADALQRRDALDEEFASVKRSYKAKIDLAVEDAAAAGAEYRSGERTHTLMCEKYEDKSTLEIVYLEPATGREVNRRKMTDDDRRLKLPMGDPIAVIGTTEPTPDNARTCINCTHMAQGTDDMPEPCQTCSQCDNGDADNWTPEKKCPTCASSTTRVGLYPCNGCSLNADAEHQGDEDRWTCKVSAFAVVMTSEEPGETDDGAYAEADAEAANDDMPTMPIAPPPEDMANAVQ